jgi:SAM-dependent methyltransferase
MAGNQGKNDGACAILRHIYLQIAGIVQPSDFTSFQGIKMAITAIEYGLLTYFRQSGALPERPHVLELGEANWYGDLNVQQLANDIQAIVTDNDTKEKLLADLGDAAQRLDGGGKREIAKIFYSVFLGQESLTTIDFYGSNEALAMDLNQPLPMGKQFDICLDFGLAEHVFNVYQFFKSVHEATKPGGIMIHGTSFTGWHDQGLFNFKPEFYWKLAAQNKYDLLGLVYAELYPLKLIDLCSRDEFLAMVEAGQIGNDALIYAVLRKSEAESDFLVPAR